MLEPIQHLVARYSLLGGTMRRRPAGTVGAARKCLGRLDLRRFGTSDPDRFLAELNESTEEVQINLPGREWGFARKGLNIFLRDCLYYVCLRKEYCLDRAEQFLEVPLDSIVAGKIREFERGVPPWKNIRDLDYDTNEAYQNVATWIAEANGFARIHLDAVWWGRG